MFLVLNMRNKLSLTKMITNQHLRDKRFPSRPKHERVNADNNMILYRLFQQ
jgi:hypothetical protein